MQNNAPCRAVVILSGSGSNLQAIIDSAKPPLELVGVISNKPQAYGLIRAQQTAIPTQVVDHQLYPDQFTFEDALITTIQSFTPKLIILAGFMRVLSPSFVDTFAGKMLNIHPSLLPKHKGLKTHQRVLQAKETEHGASVHFVTSELDSGPLVAQVKVPVLPQDDAHTLQQRVLTAEHWLYPQVIGWYAQNRLKCEENIVTLDGKRIDPQGLQLTLPTAQGIVS